MKISGFITYNFFFLMLLLFSGCSTKNGHVNPVKTAKAGPVLFDILSPAQTGINFGNKITETLSMNGIFYEYYYNGAGVAVADFNNDGLDDIYFVSNLHPDKLYLNQGNMKFRDISDGSGTADHSGFSTGVTAVDINSDGWMDLYVSNSGRFPPELMKNKLFVNHGPDKDGIPVFTEEGAKYGLDIITSSTQAAFFDYDRDNDLDMFLVSHYPDIYNVSELDKLLHTESTITGDRLYQNQNGYFVDVSKKAGIINNSLSYGLGLGISDLNNDGWPDIYVSNDYSGKDNLYINNGNGTFTECLNQAAKHISFSSMGSYLGDYNNDGLTDIITLDMMAEDNYGIKASYGSMNRELFQKLTSLGQNYQYMYNTLQINNGVFNGSKVPVFSDVAQIAGVSSTDWSWGPLLFDMDNDGKKDLFVANGIMRDFINNDYLDFFEKRYREVIETHKVSKNDFINSLLRQMPARKKSNVFFRNNGDLTFEKMNGVWAEDLPTCSNGAAYADLDNDGDLDIVVNNSDGISFIYKNNTRERGTGNYLQIKLKGPAKNPVGIGAKITIRQTKQIQVQEQYLTRGFLSSISPVLEFGLSSDTVVPEIDILWPDGRIQSLFDKAVNQTLTISYTDAVKPDTQKSRESLIFHDITSALKINYRHEEDVFDDFAREPMLPHKMSDTGPALAVADVNSDGLDDFYIGGSKGHPGKLFIQVNSGFTEFQYQPWNADSGCEDGGAVFFDADNDGLPDLYVTSGSNEYDEGSPFLKDRLYINKGSGRYEKATISLPDESISSSCVIAYDIDGDGDQDLFVGGRQKPGKYAMPVSSRILRNDSSNGTVRFTDVTSELAPSLKNIGMVTSAVFADVDGDQKPDLVITGEWMAVRILRNSGGRFEDYTLKSGLSEETGWWNTVIAADLDNDGSTDLIAGNLGLNFNYKASVKNPFQLYVSDFDNNGKEDLVFGYYSHDTLFPFHGLKRSAMQTPFVRKKYPTYDSFARATLEEVYGAANLKNALCLKVNNFQSCFLKNQGNSVFKTVPLPLPAQLSSVNSIIFEDLDGDGFKDLMIAGNLYGTDVETPRNDAGIGLFLKGDGKGGFSAVPASQSGLDLEGEVRNMCLIHIGKNRQKAVIVAKNNGYIQVVKAGE
jgi:enediyne biosynthesis protein E4